ncbi:MAG: hypothetical protein ACOX3T_06845 [Bdellovibrionota bacterium]
MIVAIAGLHGKSENLQLLTKFLAELKFDGFIFVCGVKNEDLDILKELKKFNVRIVFKGNKEFKDKLTRIYSLLWPNSPWPQREIETRLGESESLIVPNINDEMTTWYDWKKRYDVIIHGSEQEPKVVEHKGETYCNPSRLTICPGELGGENPSFALITIDRDQIEDKRMRMREGAVGISTTHYTLKNCVWFPKTLRGENVKLKVA